MKLLHEILQEEITAFYPIRPQQIDISDLPQTLERMTQDANRRKDIAQRRLLEDKALGILVQFSTHLILTTAGMPIPSSVKHQNYSQIIIETLTLWENAHNRFNEQLKINS